MLKTGDVPRVEVRDRQQTRDDFGDEMCLEPTEDRLEQMNEPLEHRFGGVQHGFADAEDRFVDFADDGDFPNDR